MYRQRLNRLFNNSNDKLLLDIDGSKGLVYDAANGALTNGRTSTATVVDSESVVRLVKANEIRFSDGNRFENLVPNPLGTGTPPTCPWYSVTQRAGIFTLVANGHDYVDIRINNTSGLSSAYNTLYFLTADETQYKTIAASCSYQLIAGSATGYYCGIVIEERTAANSLLAISGNGNAAQYYYSITSVERHIEVNRTLNQATLGKIYAGITFGATLLNGVDFTVRLRNVRVCSVSGALVPYCPRPSVPVVTTATYNAAVAGVKVSADRDRYIGINCIGDSMFTTGGGATLSTQMNWGHHTALGNGVGGETSTQIKARFVALPAATLANYIHMIWAGRNNYTSPTTVKADIAAMVAVIPHNRYVILSIMNGEYSNEYSGQADYNTLINLNAELAALYPNNFLDVRNPIVALYDVNTAQDVIDYGHDIPPSTLRVDSIHLTSAAYEKIATWTIAFLLSKGYLDNTALSTVPAILHEGEATNVCKYSEDFRNTADAGETRFYVYDNASITINQDASATGAIVADKMYITSSKTGTFDFGITTVFATGGATFSIDVNAVEITRVALAIVASSNTSRIFDLSLNAVQGALTDAFTVPATEGRITALTNGWYRCEMYTNLSTISRFDLYMLGAGTVRSYAGIANDSMLISNAMVRAGYDFSSYIPTTTAAVTRATDSIKIPLAVNTNFPQSRGYCIAKFTPLFANSATAKSLLCTSSAATDFIHDNGSGEIALNDGTNTATTSGLGGWTTNDVLRIAAAWNSSSTTMKLSVSKNGGAWVDASGTYDGAFPIGANLLLCSANTDSYKINKVAMFSTVNTIDKAITDAKSKAGIL